MRNFLTGDGLGFLSLWVAAFAGAAFVSLEPGNWVHWLILLGSLLVLAVKYWKKYL